MGININVQSIILIIMAVMIANCIISFSKNKILNKCNLVLSTIFSFVGIVGMIVIRSQFVSQLNKSGNLRDFEPEFVTWAIDKFDHFAISSIVANCVFILCLLCYLFLNKRKSGFIWSYTTTIVVAVMIINFISVVWYGLGTINKIFDIANFISQIAVAEFFALHIPLVVKRIRMNKEVLNKESLSKVE